MLDEDVCWQAVRSKNSFSDGKFFYGVVTTGVFCRPSCPSRLPLRKNVRFYASPRAAARDGLRPCLRCRPLATIGQDPGRERIQELCRFIEQHAEERLSLTALAEKAGMSPFHFQRCFKAVVGITPKWYVESRRVKKLKVSLRRCKDV